MAGRSPDPAAGAVRGDRVAGGHDRVHHPGQHGLSGAGPTGSPGGGRCVRPPQRVGLAVAGAHEGTGYLRSALPVSTLATASLSLVAASLSELAQRLGHPDAERVEVDRGLCDTWFGGQVQPAGWEAPAVWNPPSGTFPAAGGSWIRTHANAPRHRAAMLRVLGCEPERDAVARAVLAWNATALEATIVDAGGAAAALHSREEWEGSEPGAAVASEPLIDSRRTTAWHGERMWDAAWQAPLRGIRVLDLTRDISVARRRCVSVVPRSRTRASRHAWAHIPPSGPSEPAPTSSRSA